MICVVAKFVCNDGKINDLLDILKSPDGLNVTRSYKGCKLVETSISEDGDTLSATTSIRLATSSMECSSSATLCNGAYRGHR